MQHAHVVDSQTKLVARLLRDELRTQRFASYSECKDALYRRFKTEKLRPRPTFRHVNEAIQLLESNTTVVHLPGQTTARRCAPLPDLRPIGRAEAARLLQRLGCRPRLMEAW